MTTIKETFVTISWDPTIKSVVAEWSGIGSEARMKAALEQSLEIIKENQAQRWLADTRTIKPFGKEMQDWINQQWLARAVQAGIKYIAFVTPASAIARLSITTWKPTEFHQATTSAIFDDLQKGRQWISQQ